MDYLRLKTLRQAANLTQEKLSELTGLSQKQISRWESGEREPGANDLIQLAQALNTSTDFLVGLTDDPSPATANSGELSELERDLLAAVRRGDLAAALRKILDIMER